MSPIIRATCQAPQHATGYRKERAVFSELKAAQVADARRARVASLGLTLRAMAFALRPAPQRAVRIT